MDAEREMTLQEWCDKLPKCHLVNKELVKLEEKAEATDSPNVGVSNSSILLCKLKSQVANNCVADLKAALEARVCRHESGDWELIPEALADFQNDINILKKLVA